VDLAQIPIPIERPVLEGRFRKHLLVTFPPPGAGRALIEIMNILDAFRPEEVRLDTPSAYRILAHVFMHALRDREAKPADADTYAQTRNKRMLDKRHAQTIVDRIRAVTGITPPDPQAPPTGGETTHLSVADEMGNAVGITQSIELVFGSKRQNPKYGFFYNNYLTTFDYKDITHPYYLLPGASPWSSVAPTILFKKGKPWLVLGSPGSERIATSVAQVISRIVDSRMSLMDAISAPRLHANKMGAVQLEKKRFDPEVISALEEEGFSLTKRGAFSFYLGCIQAVQLPASRREPFIGVADPRRDGSAEGPEI
jgi:gamma-glutamyltranspeptidase/glutathione hydrolase